MSIVPRNKPARISFFSARIDPWTTSAATLEIEPTAVTALDTKVTDAQDAHAAFVSAQAAAKAATIAYHEAVEEMTVAGTQLIERIRATAKTGGDSIYALAQLPAPATPAPIPAPGAPYEMAATLGGDGALELAWKCNNPPATTGTLYAVERQLDGSSTWEKLGVTGERKWVDDTLPGGVTKVTYKIRGVRSTAGGPWTQFVVQFGTNTGGATPPTTATIMTDTAPKLAA